MVEGMKSADLNEEKRKGEKKAAYCVVNDCEAPL